MKTLNTTNSNTEAKENNNELESKKITNVLFWSFGLFGNSGSDVSVEDIYNDLKDNFALYKKEEECKLNELAKKTKIQIWDYYDIEEYINWKKDIKKMYSRILKRNEFPIFVGGNHLSVLPILELYSKLEKKICFISFDAHLDIYEWKDNKEKLNHGNFLLNFSKSDNLKIVNIGNRDLLLNDAKRDKIFDKIISIDDIIFNMETVCNDLTKFLENFEMIHIDIDIDALDPGLMKATGCPVPFGLTSHQLLYFINLIWDDRLVGISLSEYNALLDNNGNDRNLIIWLLEYLMLNNPSTKNNRRNYAN